MLLHEYRICLPFTVEEYHIGQLYMICKHCEVESSKDDGVEVCSFLPRFSIVVETRYEDNNGTTENCHQLSPDELSARKLEFLDIAIEQVPSYKYKESEDPCKFKSEKTGRGPLTANWREYTKPIMCAYKIIRVRFEVWGFQTRVEDFTQRAVRDILILAHRQAFTWMDEWYGMTLDQVREYEREMFERTNKKVLPTPTPTTNNTTSE
ncbi:unnamed protein product [Rotaria sp. Silwood1]|nr:unnamed protein product [Rotaria sp. Silwood1]CAF4498749.1 unnamed protein product [Rotaria sp. Silwood1]CAF4553514.1 unnamed protein product [Rotaria sp. Silwood1]CAF4590281.1 unnamed protein product [Rotaria sp. Silwood1]